MDETRRCIVALSGREALSPNDRDSHEALCLMLSEALDWPYGGWYSSGQDYPDLPYFVPFDTLSIEEAADRGVSSADSLLGGVVPHPFVATKAVAHPLVPDAIAFPAGWNRALGDKVAPFTLPGYSAFSKADLHHAVEWLLPSGPVRLKCAASRGGVGQVVVSESDRNFAFVEGLEPDILAAGVAVEVNLDDLRTISIGEVDLPGMTLAYYGEQFLTRTGHGTWVYGGSRLHVSRGNLAQLAKRDLPPGIGHAIEAALGYEHCVMAAFPGAFASRRNYDVAIGSQDGGSERVAVLEHSWRVGGASAAEIAAFAVLRQAPSRRWVETYTCEIYGDGTPPEDATIIFQGDAPGNGKLTKYCGVSNGGSEA